MLLLAVIVFQDFSIREISWYLIPLLLIAFIYKAFNTNSESSLLKNVFFNIAFMVIQIVLLTVYMSIKNKRPVNIINTYIGLGDILFFIVVCTAFSIGNFISFYLLSLLFTLSGVIIYNFFSRKKTREIPLAGIMSLLLIALIITNKLIPAINFYNDSYLLNFIKIA